MTVTVDGTASGSTSIATIALTVSPGIPAGSLVIAIVNSTATLSSVSDSRGNTWNVDVAGSTTTRRTGIASSRLTTALQGGDTITATLDAASASRSISVLHVDDGASASWFDVGGKNTGTGIGSTPTATATGAIAQARELIVGGAIIANAAGSTWTQPAGWTEVLDAVVNSNGHSSAYIVTSGVSTPTYDPDSTSANSAAWATALAAYKVGNYVLAAGAGSYSLSGVSAGLKAARRLAAAAGSYALSGVDAGLRAGRRLAADVGAYALTGSDASLRSARRLAAGAGAYALSGAAAGLAAARRLLGEAGAYALTGEAVTLQGPPPPVLGVRGHAGVAPPARGTTGTGLRRSTTRTDLRRSR